MQADRLSNVAAKSGLARIHTHVSPTSSSSSSSSLSLSLFLLSLFFVSLFYLSLSSLSLSLLSLSDSLRCDGNDLIDHECPVDRSPSMDGQIRLPTMTVPPTVRPDDLIPPMEKVPS